MKNGKRFVRNIRTVEMSPEQLYARLFEIMHETNDEYSASIDLIHQYAADREAAMRERCAEYIYNQQRGNGLKDKELKLLAANIRSLKCGVG